MSLERIEDNCIVTYKRNGEVVGVVRYSRATPSNSALDGIANRIFLIYKNYLRTNGH